MGTVLTRTWREGEQVASDWPLEQLSEQLAIEGSLVWAHLDSPSPEAVCELALELGFDPHSVEDALAPGERTKATRQGRHLFITLYTSRIVQTPSDAAHESRLEAQRISVFVLEGGLITIAPDGNFDMAPVMERWVPPLTSFGSGGLLHALIDVVIDEDFETIAQIDEACEELEDVLFDSRPHPREVQQRSYRIRRELAELRRLVLPLRDVLQLLLREDDVSLSHGPQLRAYYEDLYDHALRAAEWTESLRDMVSSIFETNLSLQDSRLNVVMKKLAGWAAVIAVPTAITGWFGQNVPYPGFSAATGYWASLISVVCTTIGVWAVMRWNDWI